MSDLLTGVVVVELASWTYVPSAGVILRDWGADVIKVEDTRGGDPCRYLTVGGLDPADSRVKASFMMEIGNHGKRSIAMDIKTDDGLAILGKLIAKADVFLTNWLPGQLERAGLSVEKIRSFNPDVIIARGSGQGPLGPERDKADSSGAPPADESPSSPEHPAATSATAIATHGSIAHRLCEDFTSCSPDM